MYKNLELENFTLLEIKMNKILPRLVVIQIHTHSLQYSLNMFNSRNTKISFNDKFQPINCKSM